MAKAQLLGVRRDIDSQGKNFEGRWELGLA